MGWYIVTKKVKGHSYLYRQRSYRVGGTVRTESEYLGPASGGGGGASSAVAEVVREPTTRIPTAAENRAWEEAQAKKKTNKKPIITTTLPPTSLGAYKSSGLVVDAKTDRRHDISLRPLVKEEEAVRAHMARHELPVEDIKPVSVMLGTTAQFQRKKNEYRVTVPMQGNRTAFKKVYREALADRWLDATAKTDPVMYQALKTEMRRHHRTSRLMLTLMILASNERDKLGGVVVCLWAGHLPKKLRRKIPAESIGRFSHDSSSWRAESREILAQMIQHGSEKVYDKYRHDAFDFREQLAIAKEEYDGMSMVRWVSPKGKELRSKIKQLEQKAKKATDMYSRVDTIYTWFETGEI